MVCRECSGADRVSGSSCEPVSVGEQEVQTIADESEECESQIGTEFGIATCLHRGMSSGELRGVCARHAEPASSTKHPDAELLAADPLIREYQIEARDLKRQLAEAGERNRQLIRDKQGLSAGMITLRGQLEEAQAESNRLIGERDEYVNEKVNEKTRPWQIANAELEGSLAEAQDALAVSQEGDRQLAEELNEARKKLQYAWDERDRARADAADQRDIADAREKLLDEEHALHSKKLELLNAAEGREFESLCEARKAQKVAEDKQFRAEEEVARTYEAQQMAVEALEAMKAEVDKQRKDYGELSAYMNTQVIRAANAESKNRRLKEDRDRIDRLCSQLYTDYREQDEWVRRQPCEYPGGSLLGADPKDDCGKCVPCRARNRHKGRP